MAELARTPSSSSSTLNIVTTGDEVPVLLIHHGLSQFDDYAQPHTGSLVRSLEARGCQVVGFDLMGHGESSELPEFSRGYLDRCVEDAWAVLGTIGSPPTPIVGVGFGGIVALSLAAARPQLVSCLLLDSLPGLCNAVPFEPWRHAVRDVGANLSPRTEAWRRFVAELDGWSQQLELERVEAPTLTVVCGDNLSTETLAGLYDFARRMPQAQVAVLPGDSPPACWHAPALFMREAERFLASYV
jgi:pimeloyl-ACP methyl ester carboxylesterase